MSEYRQRCARIDTDAIERETQRDVNASLRSQRELLKKAHEELRAEVEDLHRRRESQTPFPACTGMDEDPEYQADQELDTESLELKAFVEDLQHRIAAGPSARLFYSLTDLRSFVGGLAMGRLILLQGLSGTGKTSLPVAFARAVGTQAAEIKVQAGWRDPQDLIGHYNTFEKRFHETEFLKALYRANTPRWNDSIQIVLLGRDEPVASGAVLFGLALHVGASRRRSTPGAPDARGDGGPGPRSMGETDCAFPATSGSSARQTTMRRRWISRIRRTIARTSWSFRSVRSNSHCRTRSRAAQSRLGLLLGHSRGQLSSRRNSAKDAISFLNDNVRDGLARDFRIGWGPRLKRQMEKYVPVVVAAGGTVGEATDHVLAMRLLRKLRNRHDNRAECVEELKQRIRSSWSDLDSTCEPRKSMALLDFELRRSGL